MGEKFEYSVKHDLALWLYWFNKFYNSRLTKHFQGKLCISPADIPYPDGTVECWFEIYFGTKFNNRTYKKIRDFFPINLFTIEGEKNSDGNYVYTIQESDTFYIKTKELKKRRDA